MSLSSSISLVAYQHISLATCAAAGAVGLFLLASGVRTAPAAEPPASANSAPAARPEARTDDVSVRPFQIKVADEALADLRRRITATRWPDKETVADESQGVQLATMQQLAQYWATDYDWRKCEAKLNALPQFVTTIDGVEIHFIHVRSKAKNALPVIITHGWP